MTICEREIPLCVLSGVKMVCLLSRVMCALVLTQILFSGNLWASEKLRGYVRRTEFPSCPNGCDVLHLDPDSGYSLIYLTRDLNSTVNLQSYVELHVEVTGFRAGCGACGALFVSNVLLLGTAEVTDDPKIPEASLLRQNYPNPFNPSTAIEYTLNMEASVTLRVFNVLGEEVSTLVASGRHAGVHRVVWDASLWPGGVYFYRLLATGPDRRTLVQSRAMLLLR